MTETNKLYHQAFLLSLLTIFYNLIEGLASVFMGYSDNVLTLFGFGIDSFIEVVSGLGIAIMILRIKRNSESSKNKFEIQALKITGYSFYMLSIGLLVGIVVNLVELHKPETGLWGILISLVSIVSMLFLYVSKKTIGQKLNSAPILSDANCTKICIYMSIVLMLSSLLYQYTGFAYADLIGSVGIVYFTISEGREAFEKAKGKLCSCKHC